MTARLVLQYLEPGPALAALAPDEAAARLEAACAAAPVTDICLGWAIPPVLLDQVARTAARRATVWRWAPVFSGDGVNPLTERDLAVGPNHAPPAPFAGLDSFRFVCPNRPAAVDEAIDRLTRIGREFAVNGLFLDRIRWPSPSADPVSGLTCFCDRCRVLAAEDGLDLDAVASNLARLEDSLAGRRWLVQALFRPSSGSIVGRFLRWREAQMTRAIGTVVEVLRARGFGRVALDVFTPALARTVGQRIEHLADGAEWVKAMTYLSCWGPAGMPFELDGYAGWLEVAGEADSGAFLGALCGFGVPGRDMLRGEGLGDDALGVEMCRLQRAVGSRAAVGLDVVEIKGVVDVSDETVSRRAAAVVEAGLGLVASWDLRFIPPSRVAVLSR